jgi:hypothetical protein
MLDAIKMMMGAASDLYERWREMQGLRKDAEALRRLMLLECRRNLALLEALKLDGDAAQDDPALKHVAQELEVKVLEQLFLPGKGAAKMLAELEAVDRELLEASDHDELEAGQPEREGADSMSLLMRLYVRCVAVQKLARLPAEGEALRAIRFRTRLANIRRWNRSLVPALDPDARHKRRTRERRRLETSSG